MVWLVDGVRDARNAWLPSTLLNLAVTPAVGCIAYTSSARLETEPTDILWA